MMKLNYQVMLILELEIQFTDYGEWNGEYGKNSFGMAGNAIVLKFTEKDADDYISMRTGKYETVAHNVPDLKTKAMVDYCKGLINGGTVITINTP